MRKIKVLIKRPDEKVGHITYISDSLKNLQNTVHGPIEVVTITDGVVCICHEKGRLLGLPANCRVAGINGPLVGTIIIAGVDGEEFADIPDFITLDFWKRYMMEDC